ncbi:pyruvate:ferredoxin (flavodoxin) oxidoreductase [Arachnia propionica]|uniref:Pyruvate synthase subunit porA n=1 Tax=Arachnia propionica TaxID=1750 RepID=A0A3N4CXV9_9ACTN|nr:pyruvate:ferredoxin (flavodoxin) oxidoreductase [Arachnia propionica]AFN47140.1 pyruvate synthase [Arachnia propionica F0230a]QCT37159.1 pyruvate:ferredoxin (flavodoxin) oxidoreductase [Arachnia propionica]QUC10502.1 pyruvate:ferredoxin (flavodoxin) oxidoreductase [Arachnia propionica]QUC14809.1 pyruvate:ferredoxin (flavodoxin) oxidoreductase [Arachnia propionica]RPA17394.1 pyruvate:ferredoxin (flavodoxin) oxidoreductase [Arachnia propionica]
MNQRTIIDGNEAAADVAYRLSELCSIYPITPSSTMAELADEWSSHGRRNVFGTVPTVVEMQSEGGAAGAMHGALQGGALSTTFTASQGLLLMIPNMYRIAGELTSTVFHVAARSLAAQGLSIFGDHQDVMAIRQTGCCMLSSASVQEAHDMAAVAHLATLRARLPFVHFFDGFRTSHELNTLVKLTDDQLRELVPTDLIREHRARALSPENPFIRGTAQNPDTYFQSRETANRYYDAVPGILTEVLERFEEISGRHYSLVEYHGHPEADRVVVIMGSGIETMIPVVKHLNEAGEKVGALFVRLYRPFPKEHLLAALPATVRKVAVLDRTKEPGSGGEPLFLDVSSAIGESVARGDREVMPVLTGGRYGLSSKEFTPAMAKAVYDELAKDRPRPRFTVGINDDVTHLSLDVDPDFQLLDPQTHRAVFYGLGSDGTVGANKNTIKIIGSDPGTYAQGYFVYDSKKSGSRTVSHLRFGPNPIQAPYLVTRSNFIGCHHWSILERVDVLEFAQPGATLLINSPYPADQVWEQLPRPMQDRIVELGISLHVIDASAVARAAGLGSRTNTVLQTCFFAISGIMPREEAIEKVKAAITKTYARKSMAIVQKNHEAVDASLAHLHEVQVPTSATGQRDLIPPVPSDAPPFVREVTATMLAGRGDELPVSALPVDGAYPSGTTRYEKRNISEIIAVWDNEACIQCGNCSFVCPHAVLRAKYYPSEVTENAPEGFLSQPLDAAGLPDTSYTLQVYAEDCTGCGLCVEACPVRPAGQPNRRAINLEPVLEREKEKEAVRFFETIPLNDRRNVDFGTVRGTQFLEPLFEFSGACAGCGETPYLKLLTQLFGDRVTVANATGCSSIYGGNLPTTPWAKNARGRGPAWSNSLFEDNAEFGLGLRLAADLHRDMARRLLEELRPEIDDDELIDSLLAAKQRMESGLARQAARVDRLKARLAELEGPKIEDLKSVCDHLLRRSVWIVGGDGWAYDIGSSGVDHVLASGRNVNVLVLDTEVYSNTGGQASKSTPLGAVAKFASAGKHTNKKDMAMQAMAYGSVYVARVAMGADPQQTLKAFREAEAYEGPSLIIAYSHCIAHGIDTRKGLEQQYRAVNSGHWPLMRYNPVIRENGGNPFLLDSPRPRLRLREYQDAELRYKVLRAADPEEANRLIDIAQAQVDRRWAEYEELALRGAEKFAADPRKEESWQI